MAILNWFLGVVVAAFLYVTFDKGPKLDAALAILFVGTIGLAIWQCFNVKSFFEIIVNTLSQGYIMWSPAAIFLADLSNFFRADEVITWSEFSQLRTSLALFGWIAYLIGGVIIFVYRWMELRVSDQNFPKYPDWPRLQPWLRRLKLI